MTIWGMSARLYSKVSHYAPPPFVMRINGIKYVPLAVAEALMIERDRCARKFVAERARRKALQLELYRTKQEKPKC